MKLKVLSLQPWALGCRNEAYITVMGNKNIKCKSQVLSPDYMHHCKCIYIVQLLSYKRYLECTLVQWRLSIYP